MKLNENQKVTLTLGQLKRLVKESDGTEEQEFFLNYADRPGCDAVGTPLQPGDWVWVVSSGPWAGELLTAKVISAKKMIRVERKYWNRYDERVETVVQNRRTSQVLKIDNIKALASKLPSSTDPTTDPD